MIYILENKKTACFLRLMGQRWADSECGVEVCSEIPQEAGEGDWLMVSKGQADRAGEVWRGKLLPYDAEMVEWNSQFREGDEGEKAPARVCLFGAESTGKSTLGWSLARELRLPFATEYVRGYLDVLGRTECQYEDVEWIGRGVVAQQEALNRLEVSGVLWDTDLLASCLWSRVIYGRCPEGMEALAAERKADLYVVLMPDVPWVEDPQRCLPGRREWFTEQCLERLESVGAEVVCVSGGWEERAREAREAVRNFLTV